MPDQLGYLWAVAGVVWIGTMFYVVGLMRRQSRVQKQLEHLEQLVSDERAHP